MSRANKVSIEVLDAVIEEFVRRDMAGNSFLICSTAISCALRSGPLDSPDNKSYVDFLLHIEEIVLGQRKQGNMSNVLRLPKELENKSLEIYGYTFWNKPGKSDTVKGYVRYMNPMEVAFRLGVLHGLKDRLEGEANGLQITLTDLDTSQGEDANPQVGSQ